MKKREYRKPPSPLFPIRKTQLFALVFICLLALTATAFFQIEPVTAAGSQAATVFPSNAVYVYGSQTGGTVAS